LASTRAHINGAVAGAQLGYNWQTQNLVLGAETDFQGSTQKGLASFMYPVDTGQACASINANCDLFPPTLRVGESYTATLDYFGTIRGRAGYAFDSWLVYVTGGWVYGRFTTASDTPSGAISSGSTFRSGWALGGGIEGAIGQNWSWKAEYLALDFGSWNGQSTAQTQDGPFVINHSIHGFDNILRVGLNYHF